VLPDYGDTTLSPLKWGQIHDVFIQALETGTGDAAVDTANTSPGASIAAGAAGHPGTGEYAFTFPKGTSVQPIAAFVDAAAATAAAQRVCFFRNLNATAGTGTIIVTDTATPTLTNLADNQRLYISIKVTRRV
jgi:hypothetical protein